MRLDIIVKAGLLLVLAAQSAPADSTGWQPVSHAPGLVFQAEIDGSGEHSCLVRLREDRKLRRTTSDLAISYSFQQANLSRKQSVLFEARDSATVYLPSCDFVIDVVATNLRRR